MIMSLNISHVHSRMIEDGILLKKTSIPFEMSLFYLYRKKKKKNHSPKKYY